MAAVNLLTWVMISKYLDHLPLYRLEQIAARDHVILARSTLAEWVGRTGVALQPLSDRLSEILLECGTLHADETPVPQLDPGSGKTKRAYLWAYRSNGLEEGHRIISSITGVDVAASTHASSWVRGKSTYWSMTMVAIRPCSPLHAKKRHLALSWVAGHTHAGSSSICTRPMPAPWRWKP